MRKPIFVTSSADVLIRHILVDDFITRINIPLARRVREGVRREIRNRVGRTSFDRVSEMVVIREFRGSGWARRRFARPLSFVPDMGVFYL